MKKQLPLLLAVFLGISGLNLSACASAGQETIGAAEQTEAARETETEASQEETKQESNGAESGGTESAETEDTADGAAENQPKGFFEEFTMEDLDGNPVNQEIFRDYDLTMVNIWATFCGPCITEMPDLGELHRTWSEKGVQVVGLCTDVVNIDGTLIDEQMETARLIVEETGADYLHLIPAGEVAARLLPQIQVVPTTVFVDKDGKQVTSIVTGSRSLESWEEMIEELLKEQ